MKYKPSVIRESLDSSDLFTLILNLKEIRDELMNALDKLNPDIKMLEEIWKEKIAREKK